MTSDEVYRLALGIYGDPAEARIAAAQYQLETGGGRSMPGNNLFGIKGPGGTYPTTEVVNGRPVRTQASFRSYDNPSASITDRLDFLRTNPRYAKAGYFDATTPEEKAEALQRAGYATDPNYANKLKALMSPDGVTTMPVSAFPQFSAQNQGMVPVSAQPAGLMGAAPGPLLGAQQPQGLLDMFAPGSGFGYDVALGMANTPGGPMTAIAGGMAHAKDRAFEREMMSAKMSGTTSAMRNYEFLLSQGVDPQTAMAAFGGTTVNVGNQPGATQYGSVPAGHTRTIDAEGNAVDTPNPGTEAYEKRVADKRITESAVSAIERMKTLVTKHGEGLSLVGDAKTQLEMGTAYEEVLAMIGKLGNAGVMDKGEVERFKESLPDPRSKFTFAGKQDIIAAYDALLERLGRVKGTGPGQAAQKATHRFNPQTGQVEQIQ